MLLYGAITTRNDDGGAWRLSVSPFTRITDRRGILSHCNEMIR